MSEVFLARLAADPDSDLIVIKRLLRQHREQEALVEMFLVEARRALRLEHPNIVDVRDTGQVGDDYYMVMEYVVGLDLFELTAEMSRVLPPGVCVRILLDASAGLDYVHATGVVHRDVNPHNLLVTEAGTTKLTDFGVAVDEHETNEQVRGTPAYMAPEQVQNQPIDRRTDVFAVGVILWELFAGKRLFGGVPPYLCLARVVEEPAPPLPDPDLDRIARRALAKEPADRYSSCAELAAALRDLASDRRWDTSTAAVASVIPTRP
jgi:serine/threonine-protein kinase